MAGMGVLHLDVAVNLIKDAKIEIITSEPLINYRETILGSSDAVMANHLTATIRFSWQFNL